MGERKDRGGTDCNDNSIEIAFEWNAKNQTIFELKLHYSRFRASPVFPLSHMGELRDMVCLDCKRNSINITFEKSHVFLMKMTLLSSEKERFFFNSPFNTNQSPFKSTNQPTNKQKLFSRRRKIPARTCGESLVPLCQKGRRHHVHEGRARARARAR